MNLEVVTKAPESTAHSTPILFVHGMWHAAWCWAEHFLPYFARRGYRCYALSLRGHGSSDGHKRLRWTSLTDYVSDVRQVVRRIQPALALVGHSMGGMVVQEMLELNGAPAAVLLASAPPGGADPCHRAGSAAASAGIYQGQHDVEPAPIGKKPRDGS